MHSARYISRNLSLPTTGFLGDSSTLSYPQIITLNKPKIYISIGYLTTFPKKKDFWIFQAGASRSCLTINPCSKVKVKRVKVIIQKPVTYKISRKILMEIRLPIEKPYWSHRDKLLSWQNETILYEMFSLLAVLQIRVILGN